MAQERGVHLSQCSGVRAVEDDVVEAYVHVRDWNRCSSRNGSRPTPALAPTVDFEATRVAHT